MSRNSRLLQLPVLSALLVSLPSGSASAGPPEFTRGDLNLDGSVSLADASYYFDARFLNGPPPRCVDAADTDDNGLIDFSGIADGEFLLGALFNNTGTIALPAPFPSPGSDPTPDNLNCDDPGITPPVNPHPGYGFSWEGASAVAAGWKDVELFLLVDTAGPIACFSIAFRVNKDAVENVRVDLTGTIFPQPLRSTYESSPAFRWRLRPLPNSPHDLLQVGAIFVADTQSLPLLGDGAGGGGAYGRILFAATTGPVAKARLLRVVVDIRRDAPRGDERPVLSPALVEDLLVVPGAVHGVRNEFGSPGGEASLTVTPLTIGELHPIIYDPGEFFRGDFDQDAAVNIADASATLNHLFLDMAGPRCWDAADTNDDGQLDVSDPIRTLFFLFLGTPEPPAPGARLCGFDRTRAVLDCEECCRCAQ
jgi:hypothetical protein